MKILRIAAITGTLLVLSPAIEAGATQLPDDEPNDWVLSYPSDLSITYSETGNTGMTLAEMTQVNYNPNWPGMGPNNYWNNSFTGDPYSRSGTNSANQLSWYSQTWGGNLWFSAGTLSKTPCPVTATRGVEMRCERNDVKFTFSRPVTNPVLHFNNLGANSYADAGPTGGGGEWWDQRLWMHGDTILTLDLAASTYSGTPALVLESRIGNFAVVTDGSTYHLPAGSPLNGAPAITRTSDPSVDTTGRPGGHYVGGSFGAGSVRIEGTWSEIVFNRDLLWSFNTYSATTTPWRLADGSRQGYDVALQARNECLLNQVPSSTIYRCDGSGNTWSPNTAVDVTTSVYNGLQVANPIPEGTSFVITVDEDFGNAPATYDASNGASHVVGGLSIGARASSTGAELNSQNVGASGIVSPNAGATDGNDDAFSNGPMLPESGDYSVAIPVANVTAPAKLCGWIDADSSGTFELAERACANVSPGASSANLLWSSSVTSSITTGTWMRLRLSYDTNGVESPLGRVDSGEVEDWRLATYSPPPPTTSTTPTTSTAVAPTLPATGTSTGLLPLVAFLATSAGITLLVRTRRKTV